MISKVPRTASFRMTTILSGAERVDMKRRRLVAALLIGLGAVMLFAAPQTTGGLVAIAAGVIVEAIGLTLEKRNK